jgi:hypothetical protein
MPPAYTALGGLISPREATAGFAPAPVVAASTTTTPAVTAPIPTTTPPAPVVPVVPVGTNHIASLAVSAGANEGAGTRTVDQANKRLEALGVQGQRLEQKSNGEWRFACSILWPNKERPTVNKKYESTLAGPNGANAMWAVLDQIDQDHH